MDSPTGGETGFSELQLGIRELFRIIVPGAYLAALVYVLAPGSDIVTLMDKGTTVLIITVFFFGLFGYALRPHERWWPYYRGFEGERVRLNTAIIKCSNGDENIDYVGPYKYFLETEASNLKDRVHYFSSFYYMLIELSLFSGGGAIALTLTHLTTNNLFHFRSLHVAPPGTFIASLLMLAAGAAQVYLLRGLSSIRVPTTDDSVDKDRRREQKDRRASLAPVLLLVMALVWLAIAQIYSKQYSLLIASLSDYRTWLLVTLAVIFERLALKQWTAIIGEQVVLVREHAEAIRRIARHTSV